MPQLIQTKSCCFILFLSVGSAICNFYIYQSYVLEMEKEKKLKTENAQKTANK